MVVSCYVIMVSFLEWKTQNGQVILVYLEIAFYIDKKGRRVRPDWTMHWEGHPTLFAFKYPYVVAFDPSFIEVRHMNTVSCIVPVKYGNS